MRQKDWKMGKRGKGEKGKTKTAGLKEKKANSRDWQQCLKKGEQSSLTRFKNWSQTEEDKFKNNNRLSHTAFPSFASQDSRQLRHEVTRG
jgi:hypothetical protein